MNSWKSKKMSSCVLSLSILWMGCVAVSWAKTCPDEKGDTLLRPYGNLKTNYKTDLLVTGKCDVNDVPGQSGPLLYVFHNVNIIKGGSLIFHDDYPIDFYAESILVENEGKLVAVSTGKGFLPQVSTGSNALPFQTRLTFHLWGPPGDSKAEDELRLGIECKSPEVNDVPCGIPPTIWENNKAMADNMVKNPPPPPTLPKNQACVHTDLLPDGDCFYQYEVQDKQDIAAGRKAYFGHKVLAVSYGGTLQLFGSKGVSYLKNNDKCNPTDPKNECSPAFTGTSWVRLTKVIDAKTITVSRPVDWQKNDHIVVTTTDYLPSHSEEAIIDEVSADRMEITLHGARRLLETCDPAKGLCFKHYAKTYSLEAVPKDIGPADDPNTDIKSAIDTRAAVALLTRNIQIVSEGDVPSVSFDGGPKDYYFGGHTIARQGFASYQVQGVEFYELGQGGAIGRYPVHFHMARKTPQPVPASNDPTPEPLNYLKDCSIHESMTRWVTVHGTEGMYIARNVGFESFGHGFYLEDATETDNKFYANIGISAKAAIQDAEYNPRQVPGILADNTPGNSAAHNNDYMPYRSDYNHPSVFWIMNGWNDFKYNMAVGAATCGACYWWLPGSNSGPSQYETWDGYSSQQIMRNKDTNIDRGGFTPLKSFVGNSCVAAMSSFQMNGQTAECLGVSPDGTGNLSAVKSKAPPGPNGERLDEQPFQVYYPVIRELHNPTLCATKDCSPNVDPCDGNDTAATCAVTQLDHYTTSFNFAQTNFSAVWLRKGWDLVTNSAFTDVQTGGLNFITGGGYTRSDVNLGEWMLVRNSAFVGHSQPFTTNGVPDNAFAADVGPFNEYSKTGCDNLSDVSHDHCEYAKGGMSFNLPVFPGQKLFNIYDGPSHQQRNAYLDITSSKIDDCFPRAKGACLSSKVPLVWNNGVLTDKNRNDCYLPNAAVAWKQPNGFYYPPAFHSDNLWFDNVDIRHFVVEPLFVQIAPDKCNSVDQKCNPFEQDQEGVTKRYCTYTSDMFSADFNSIDRQTVLNDDDGTLTGRLGKENGAKRPSISINEDPYFDTLKSTPECLSDVGVLPNNPTEQFYTATTSPYEWLSTAIIADCAIVQKVGASQCFDSRIDNHMHWSISCTKSFCRGVPLFREYLTDDEYTKKTRPQIRMMGQATAQRSTLSLNHGAYYLDTTQNCNSMGGCPECRKVNREDPTKCDEYDTNPYRPSIFLKNHTYYVYFLYATDKTKQKYDIYVGDKTNVTDLKVTPIVVNPNDYKIDTATDGSFLTPPPSYKDKILTVNVDLSGQEKVFASSKKLFCNPKSYCEAKDDGSCGCKPGTGCVRDSDCAWASNDIDCPVLGKDKSYAMQCFGFSFTMPDTFEAPDWPKVPPDSLFSQYSENGYFANDVTFTDGESISPNDTCKYPPTE